MRRRIILVSAGTCTLCVVLVAALLYQHHQLQRQLRQQRDHAVALVAAGQFAEARGVLEGFLHRRDATDIEAMWSLGRAIMAEPRPSRGDRVQAMRLFRRVAELEPNHLSARLALLGLEHELGFDHALLDTAAQVLALTDDAAHVRRARAAKTAALSRLERHEAALAMAEAMVAEAMVTEVMVAEAGASGAMADAGAGGRVEAVVEAHRLLLEVLDAGPWPARRMVEYARAQQQAHADDMRFEVLLAAAARRAGRASEAAAALDRSLDQPMPDAVMARWLITELEAMDRFDDAFELLRRAAPVLDEPTLEVALATRLWERGHDAEVEAVVDRVLARSSLQASNGTGTGAVDSASEATLLAMRAMALTRMGRSSEAERSFGLLRDLSVHDAAAAAWTIYVTGVFDQRTTPRVVIRRCRQALTHDPANPYVRFTLGEALAQRGEREVAIIEWRKAAAARPAWAAPRLQASRALTELGLATQALELAEAARRRMGDDNLEARIVLAEALQLNLAHGGRESKAALLELVGAIQHERRYEPRTLPMYVNLLAELRRREDASETLLAALGHSLPESTLLRLARVSRAHGLGLSEACKVQSEALHGRTPALSYARAVDVWNRGGTERALRELRPPEAAASEGRSDRPVLEWRLAEARFLDQIGDERAGEQWVRLVADYPDSLRVQRAALEAEAVRADRRLTRQVIDRLRGLNGEEAVGWRLAKAQWLLDVEPVTPERAAEAALLLGPVRREGPELVEPRLWLARAFAALGESEVAIAELRTANDHAPRHQPVLLELARLLIEQDQAAEALARLNAVVNNPASSVSQLQDAAAMLVRLRGWDEAVAALTRAAEAGGRSPGELLLVGGGAEEADLDDAERTERE